MEKWQIPITDCNLFKTSVVVVLVVLISNDQVHVKSLSFYHFFHYLTCKEILLKRNPYMEEEQTPKPKDLLYPKKHRPPTSLQIKQHHEKDLVLYMQRRLSHILNRETNLSMSSCYSPSKYIIQQQSVSEAHFRKFHQTFGQKFQCLTIKNSLSKKDESSYISTEFSPLAKVQSRNN